MNYTILRSLGVFSMLLFLLNSVSSAIKINLYRNLDESEKISKRSIEAASDINQKLR